MQVQVCAYIQHPSQLPKKSGKHSHCCLDLHSKAIAASLCCLPCDVTPLTQIIILSIYVQITSKLSVQVLLLWSSFHSPWLCAAVRMQEGCIDYYGYFSIYSQDHFSTSWQGLHVLQTATVKP